MKSILTILLITVISTSFSQVFNYGYNHNSFKNLLTNGICFLKTGDSEFDSTMLDALDKYWTITDFTFKEQYKHPDKEGTALFVTTKTKTKKHVMDRKNQHVLVLQPASLWKKDKQVPFDETLGYMYFNGFYEIMDKEEEHLFVRYMVQSLNKGLTIINEKKLHSENQDLNEKIAAEITAEHKGLLANTLILNREFLVHYIKEKDLQKFDVTHRLHAKDEFFKAVQTNKDRTHYIMYFSVNTTTELSLINIFTGELIYTRHFPKGYAALTAKDWKILAPYF